MPARARIYCQRHFRGFVLPTIHSTRFEVSSFSLTNHITCLSHVTSTTEFIYDTPSNTTHNSGHAQFEDIRATMRRIWKS
uniref:AlNc14C119G6607 protein n=1 Tax=Albugo laibachii Nc14 TaxID=890382 RepID=F0WJ75_9STRA|nr:AlNc14C119G6607 [Albugo laibachii Nc14]|eukprot:CCA21322.1 AlNc14C119G6607 [Albugo laibachii Nc14]